jgi:hypothetical protein
LKNPPASPRGANSDLVLHDPESAQRHISVTADNCNYFCLPRKTCLFHFRNNEQNGEVGVPNLE